MAKLVSIGDILDQTIELYRNNFKAFMSVSLWFFVISFFSIIGTLLSPGIDLDFLITQGLLTSLETTGIIISIISFGVIAPIVGVWVYVATTIMAANRSKNGTEGLKSINSKTWKLFIPYAWVAILKSLMLFFIPAAMVIPGFILIGVNLFTNAGLWIGVLSLITLFLGVIAGLVLMVLLTVWLGFPEFAVIIDKIKGTKALKESKRLIKGRFWAVLWRMFIPKLIFSAGIILVQIIIVIIVIPTLEFSNLDVATTSQIGSILDNLLSFTITALTIPLFIIADYILYDSLRNTVNRK